MASFHNRTPRMRLSSIIVVTLLALTSGLAAATEPVALLRCNSIYCAGPLYTYCSERADRDALLSMPENLLSDEDKRALQACQRAAELGFPEAQFMEGLRHSMWAMSVPARAADEQARAAELWRVAAEHGHSVAQMMLAQLYVDGKGVPKDRVEAYKWLKLAEWHKDESEALQKLKRSMSAEEIQRGDALVQAWQVR
ncbi:tetratricopeptide repeat protein [Ralstonia pseudosolanacearum]|uniref:tetratricopeptide repeat protein n=2 Tax=Ralstonia pseudosolanacearum TaxID=1310165 RepID=UPI0018D11C87|nr:SEL1-like repeat protein [Ralstonia pseudosolanacearum]